MLKRIQVFTFHSTELPGLTQIMVKKGIGLALWLTLFLMIADFFNWNRVKIRYCDGASFTGDAEDKVDFDILRVIEN